MPSIEVKAKPGDKVYFMGNVEVCGPARVLSITLYEKFGEAYRL